jgi:hypothetical protein
MKTFKLINKNGEAINKFKSDSLEESIEYFSEVKKLTKKELLKIYNVVEDEDRGINR